MKKLAIPHLFITLICLIGLAILLVFIVPSGSYEIIKTDNIEGSSVEAVYYQISQPLNPFFVLNAFYKGFEANIAIILSLLIMGGLIGVLYRSGIFDAVVKQPIEKSTSNKKTIIGGILCFSLLGAFIASYQLILLLMPLGISVLCKRINSKLIITAIIITGFASGVAGSLFNPFTVGVIHQITGVSILSGFIYRLLCWGLFTAISIFFVLHLAKKEKLTEVENSSMDDISSAEIVENPSKIKAWGVFATLLLLQIGASFYFFKTNISVLNFVFTDVVILPIITVLYLAFGLFSVLKSRQSFNITLLIFNFIYLIVGINGFQWEVSQVITLFVVTSTAIAINNQMKIIELYESMISGIQTMVPAVLTIGLAGVAIMILKEGMVLDTIIHSMVDLTAKMGEKVSVEILFVLQSTIHILISEPQTNSAFTLALFAPVCNINGISMMALSLSAQFAIGLMILISPTSPMLLTALSNSAISYNEWMKKIFPLSIIFFIVAILLLIPFSWML